DPGGDRRGRAGADHRAVVVSAVRLAPGRFVRDEDDRRAARAVRRPRDQGRAVSTRDGRGPPRDERGRAVSIDVSLPISVAMMIWPGDPAVAIHDRQRMARGDAANVSEI